ncbi:hypothetical protein CDAR_265331 [Caerostris darwini]|uniref:Uncharacterized protein n=1 Tax=Caerostris darwini TaxID=1538125 RepID=A0AAV4W2M7_9ARAC|nr:hypothetical protein CDAR_265331 [Caerostris darwini]
MFDEINNLSWCDSNRGVSGGIGIISDISVDNIGDKLFSRRMMDIIGGELVLVGVSKGVGLFNRELSCGDRVLRKLFQLVFLSILISCWRVLLKVNIVGFVSRMSGSLPSFSESISYADFGAKRGRKMRVCNFFVNTLARGVITSSG